MDIKTYTNIWNVERKLYTIYDFTLPVPISFKQLGIFAMAAILWCPIMYIIGVPITNPYGFTVWFGPPIGMTILGNKPIFEGKSIIQYAASNLTYYLRGHVYTNVSSRKSFKNTRRYVSIPVWFKKNSKEVA